MVTNKLYVKTINKIALTLSITFCLTYILYEHKNIGSYNFYFLLLSATLPLVVLFNRLKKYLFAKRYFFLVICTGLFFCSINFGNQGGYELYFLLIVCIAGPLFSNYKKNRGSYIIIVVIFCLWLTLFINDFTLFDINQFNEAQRNEIQPYVLMGLLTNIILSLLFYSYENININKEMAAINKKIIVESEEKTNFVNLMSHEIRTPLNAMNGLIHILKTENPEEHQQSYLESMEEAGKLLLDKLNNYLTFIKYEVKKVNTDKQEVNILELTESLVIASKLILEKKGIKFELDIDKYLPIVKLDSDKFSIILNQLLSNAVKHTNEGTVSLSIKEKNKHQIDKATIEVTLKDTGCGLSETKQQLILDKNNYLSSLSMQNDKVGLGLQIVKKILTIFNSNLEIKSKPGLGSLFKFTLELDKVTETASNIETPQQKDLKIDNKKILIVDDNRLNIIVTQKILEAENAIIDSACNGLEALEKVKVTDYDLILMDIHMPVLNGYKATEEIRKFNSKIPIFALSGELLDEVKVDLNYYGLNGLIIKPYEPNYLITVLKNNIGYE